MAVYRRPRPSGGRHPPLLAPTVSNFKPRAQWTNSGSSIFLYVNLPGFYMDQIEIKKDERTRTVQIQGQRPLSTHTRSQFNEAYRVPESCDMTNMSTSFSHGLLTIEFPAVLEGEKPEKAVHDQRKTVQSPNQEERRGPGLNGSSLGRKRRLDEDKQVITSQGKAAPMANEEEEPKTYKSVVEDKKAVPTGSREKPEKKVKEGEAIPSLELKERVNGEKVVKRKEATQLGQQKPMQKLKEEEVNTPMVGDSLKLKVHAKEEKVTERDKDASISHDKTGQKVKEEGVTKTPIIGRAKAEDLSERKGDGEKEQGKINLGQKKHVKYKTRNVGDEARRTEADLKTKENVERIARDVDGNVKSKEDHKNDEMVGNKVSEGEIQETAEQKKIEEDGLAKETGDVKENAEVVEPEKVYSDDPIKERSNRGGEDREKMVEKSLESEIGAALMEEGKNNTDIDPPAVGGRGIGEEKSRKYEKSLVNVGVAAFVIMGFGAYVFVPLVKNFY